VTANCSTPITGKQEVEREVQRLGGEHAGQEAERPARRSVWSCAMAGRPGLDSVAPTRATYATTTGSGSSAGDAGGI
jgi:hypothetical protein